MDHDTAYAPQSPPLEAETPDGDAVLVVGWIVHARRAALAVAAASDERIAGGAGAISPDMIGGPLALPVVIHSGGNAVPMPWVGPLEYRRPAATREALRPR